MVRTTEKGVFVVPLTVVIIITEDWNYGSGSKVNGSNIKRGDVTNLTWLRKKECQAQHASSHDTHRKAFLPETQAAEFD
jgi:hypothetical protein